MFAHPDSRNGRPLYQANEERSHTQQCRFIHPVEGRPYERYRIGLPRTMLSVGKKKAQLFIEMHRRFTGNKSQ
jgi:hypothetical protein